MSTILMIEGREYVETDEETQARVDLVAATDKLDATQQAITSIALWKKERRGDPSRDLELQELTQFLPGLEAEKEQAVKMHAYQKAVTAKLRHRERLERLPVAHKAAMQAVATYESKLLEVAQAAKAAEGPIKAYKVLVAEIEAYAGAGTVTAPMPRLRALDFYREE